MAHASDSNRFGRATLVRATLSVLAVVVVTLLAPAFVMASFMSTGSAPACEVDPAGRSEAYRFAAGFAIVAAFAPAATAVACGAFLRTRLRGFSTGLLVVGGVLLIPAAALAASMLLAGWSC